jgi:hypothetical protein
MVLWLELDPLTVFKDESKLPKFNPNRVREHAPDVGIVALALTNRTWGAAKEKATLKDPRGTPFETRTGRLIPNPLTPFPKTAESEIQTAFSQAVAGRDVRLRGIGLWPIETLAEPMLEENPDPTTLSKTEPVNPGETDATKIGAGASCTTLAPDKDFNNAEVTTRVDVNRIDPDETLQIVDESEIHCDDWHELPERDIHWVIEATPKFKPTTDNDIEPVLAAFKTEDEFTVGNA